jgi:hypothetical protein
MKKCVLIIVIIGLLFGGNLFAQGIAKVGTAGYQFLKIPAGARGVSLGDAGDVIIRDASTMFLNPAALNYVENYSVFINHSEYLADMSHEAIGIAKNFSGLGTIGINLVYLDSGPIDETTVEFQNGTGNTFNAKSYAVGISFARMLTDRFGVGANVKYVNEDLTSGLSEDNATGAWAVDMGTYYYPGFKYFENLRLSMSIRNFGPEVRLSGSYYDFDGIKGQFLEEESSYSEFPLPLTFRFGIGFDPVDTKNHKLSLAVMGEHPNDNKERLNLGSEYVFNNLLALRGGYVLNHDTRTFSAGFGLQINALGNTSLKIDYAYTQYGVLEDFQIFSLLFDW